MTITITSHNDTNIAISFNGQFSSKMLDAVRSVPNRTYNPEQKIWLIPDNQQSADTLLRNLYETDEFNISNAGSDNSVQKPQFPNENTVNKSTPSHQNNHTHELQKLKEILITRHYSPRTI